MSEEAEKFFIKEWGIKGIYGVEISYGEGKLNKRLSLSVNDLYDLMQVYADKRVKEERERIVEELSGINAVVCAFRDSLHSEDRDCYYYKGQVTAYNKAIKIVNDDRNVAK